MPSTAKTTIPKTSRESLMSSRKGQCVLTPEILDCENDEKFLKSLRDFIVHEEQYLRCPEEGPSELRYVLYRSVFNKVIARSSLYKRVLLRIKSEYDDIVRAVSQRQEEVREAQRSLKASSLRPRSMEMCQSRATGLTQRISDLNEENGRLQQVLDRQKELREQTQVPGLTEAESEDPQLLDKHLQQLQSRRDALLQEKNICVPLEVRTRLEEEQLAQERRRDGLETENRRLQLLYKRLRFVSERLCAWREQGQCVPLDELLSSALEDLRNASVSGDEALSIDTELLESEAPVGVNEAEQLTDFLDRFVELFDSAQFGEAAQLAAHSPHGLLRNLQTVHMFKAILGPPDGPPPLLHLFRSLLMTTAAGHRLPADVSCEGVRCALEQGEGRLLTHAVHFHKLTYSEPLGDVLTEHAQGNVSAYHSDMLLAMAFISYQACGAHRKAALSLCRRGLTRSGVELMRSCEQLTPDDYLWVLCEVPSLSLLRALTDAEGGAVLPVGVVCASLLSDPRLQECALQFLDFLVTKGEGSLEAAILEDSGSSVGDWGEVAEVCSSLKRPDLTHRIMSVLLSQSGTGLRTSDPEGAQLMEHIFL